MGRGGRGRVFEKNPNAGRNQNLFPLYFEMAGLGALHSIRLALLGGTGAVDLEHRGHRFSRHQATVLTLCAHSAAARRITAAQKFERWRAAWRMRLHKQTAEAGFACSRASGFRWSCARCFSAELFTSAGFAPHSEFIGATVRQLTTTTPLPVAT
jgi:hypothetical protein